MITAPDPTQITESTPVLQGLVAKLLERPSYLAFEPLPVDPETWKQGETEMRAVLKARGWPVLPVRKSIGHPNFLLMGVPIVCGEGD
jgi:hypothetical protein